MDKETIAEVFQGLTGLAAVAVLAAVVLIEPNNTAAMTLGAAVGLPVIAMYFQQRATTKATNGALSTFGTYASQMQSAQESTAARVAQQTGAILNHTANAPVAVNPPAPVEPPKVIVP